MSNPFEPDSDMEFDDFDERPQQVPQNNPPHIYDEVPREPIYVNVPPENENAPPRVNENNVQQTNRVESSGINKINSIQNLIHQISTKIKTLCDNELNDKYITYLENLMNDNASLLMKKDKFKKIESTIKKLQKQLKSFRSTVVNDCTDLMMIATEIDLIKRRFDDLQKDYEQLKRDLGRTPTDQNNYISEPFKSGQYLSMLIQMHAKAQKVINSYNDRVNEYNIFISNFNQFISEFNRGYIIYTSPVTDKYYSILLTDIVKEILAIISPNAENVDALERKRREIFKMFETTYDNDLARLIADSALDEITGLVEVT
ncbi:GSCOCT00007870001.2-RA-CDS [Cotesia congregata]|uniref:Cc_35a_1 n=1 Tax=Cotesia congregata TaxID=51543 RepID=A0A8J2MQR6_COTCN|nr:GSCOCT00007870001.2-RA-CDS [Cotesia congregata]CAG5089923.1 Cc_35a_1 [Cotesia congregata]